MVASCPQGLKQADIICAALYHTGSACKDDQVHSCGFVNPRSGVSGPALSCWFSKKLGARAARHEFVKQAFLSDTEDWRSNARIGSAHSTVAAMDIVKPECSTYLKKSATLKMSYAREMSLKRAVSHRAVFVHKDGTLASTQYSDQYVDRDRVAADLKRSVSVAGAKALKRGASVRFGGADDRSNGNASTITRSTLARSLTKCALSHVDCRTCTAHLENFC